MCACDDSRLSELCSTCSATSPGGHRARLPTHGRTTKRFVSVALLIWSGMPRVSRADSLADVHTVDLPAPTWQMVAADIEEARSGNVVAVGTNQWLRVMGADGTLLWEVPLEGLTSSLAVGDIDGDRSAESFLPKQLNAIIQPAGYFDSRWVFRNSLTKEVYDAVSGKLALSVTATGFCSIQARGGSQQK